MTFSARSRRTLSPVLAAANACSDTPVVAAVAAADLHDAALAATADHRTGKQGFRENIDAATLRLREARPALGARPDAANLGASGTDPVPKLGSNDPERLVVTNTPLGLVLREDTTLAGTGVAPGAGLVPDPVADVLLLVENAGDRASGPPPARTNATGDELFVEKPANRRSGLTVGICLEDADDDGSLIAIDAHLVPLGPGGGSSCRSERSRRERTDNRTRLRQGRSRGSSDPVDRAGSWPSDHARRSR